MNGNTNESDNIGPNQFSPNDFTESNDNDNNIDNSSIDGKEYIKNLQTTIENLKNEIDTFRRETMNDEDLIHKIINMRMSLQLKLQELEKTNKLLIEQINDVTTKLENCDDELTQKRMETLEFIQLKLKLEEEKYSIKSQMQKLEDDKKELNDQINFLNEELTILKTDNEEMTNKIKDQEAKMYDLTQRLTDMNHNLLQLCAEVQHLRYKRTTLWNSVWNYFFIDV